MPKVSTQHHLQHSAGAWDALVGYLTAITAHQSSHAAGGSDALAAALAAVTHPAYAESLLTKHIYPPFCYGIAGNLFCGADQTVAGNSGTDPLTADTIFFSPLWVPRPFTPSNYFISISTQGGASAAARIGFYAVGTNGFPGALVHDGGAVDITTTGIKAVDYSTQVAAGLYFMAVISNDSNARVHMQTTSLAMFGMNGSMNNSINRFSRAQAYGALPDPAPGGLSYGAGKFSMGFTIGSVP